MTILTKVTGDGQLSCFVSSANRSLVCISITIAYVTWNIAIPSSGDPIRLWTRLRATSLSAHTAVTCYPRKTKTFTNGRRGGGLLGSLTDLILTYFRINLTNKPKLCITNSVVPFLCRELELDAVLHVTATVIIIRFFIFRVTFIPCKEDRCRIPFVVPYVIWFLWFVVQADPSSISSLEEISNKSERREKGSV
jgi:hypothetical protein